MTNTPILQLRGIRRVFGTGSPTLALRDINLDVYQGEMVAIMGPSGAGKSTLLNILGLLDSPTGGTYLLDGRPVEGLSENAKNNLRSATFGFVFQAAHMLPHESSAQNVALGLAINGVALKSRNALVREALREVGLLHRHSSLARTLSGGERQRLAIARALATNPSIILADEPTGNLDTRNTREILSLLQQLRKQGKTIVLITHDPDVARIADRTVELADGVLPLLPQPAAGQNLGSSPTVSRPQSRRTSRWASAVERLAEALSNLTSRPLRTLMLICAFMLGTGGLVAATGIAATASIQVSSRLAEGALDRITVYVPSDTPPESRSDQVDGIQQLGRVEGAALKVPVERKDAAVTVLSEGLAEEDSQRFSGEVIGVGSDYPALFQVGIHPHQAAQELDASTEQHVAVIGKGAAAELGYGPDKVGYQLWIQGRIYTVVGIITEKGKDERLLSSILIPRSNVPARESQIDVRTEMGYPAAVAQAIPLAVNPANPGQVEVSTVGDLRNLSIGVANDLGTLVALTSAVLLIMAMLSAGTAMFLSVQSRTQEIALRRAIGMSKSGIYANFLSEGTLVGGAGGVAGVAVGLASVVVISSVQGWTAALPTSSIVVGLATGFLGGMIAALIPAWAATRIEPAQAIR